MNPEKVGKFIKDLRKKNNLTQADLANKYNVTYQAVSKWENGINLPDVTLLRKMSKDFNISIEDLLDGEPIKKNKNRKRKIITFSLIFIIVIATILLIINIYYNSSFKFSTISSMCSDFKVTGSLAYDKNKSSIYISDVNYLGENCDIVYDKIESILYENVSNNKLEISSSIVKEKTTLDNFLSNFKLNVNDYEQACKTYDANTLYLEINAYNGDNVTTYKIPLNIDNSCS